MRLVQPRRVSLVYLVYFLLHLGFHSAAQLFETLPGISLWYPPAGLAMALVTTLGWRAVPVVLAANVCSSLLGTAHEPSWLQWVFPILISTVYSLAGGLIRRECGAIPRPTKPIATALVLGLLLFAPTIAACAGVLTLWLAGVLQPGPIWRMLGSWWLGDFTGVITVVPFCFVHLTPRLLEGHPPPPSSALVVPNGGDRRRSRVPPQLRLARARRPRHTHPTSLLPLLRAARLDLPPARVARRDDRYLHPHHVQPRRAGPLRRRPRVAV